MGKDIDGGELIVGNAQAFGISIFIKLRAHPQSCLGRRGGDELNDRAITAQRLAAPIDRDERKQPMLDFIPLAGARRQMADRDREFELVG